MKTLISNIKYAIRNKENVSIGGGEFDFTELNQIVQLYEAALQAKEALDFSVAGEPLPTLETKALTLLRAVL